MPPAEPSLVAAHPDVEPLLDARGGAQRARLLEAMAQVVAEKGYAAATVADVVRAAARLARHLLRAVRLQGGLLPRGLPPRRRRARRRASRAAVRAERRRLARAAARRACAPTSRTLAGEPRFARTYLLEIHAAGPRAQAARDDALRRFAERYRASSRPRARSATARGCPSDDALFVLRAGVEQLVARAPARAGGAACAGLEDGCCRRRRVPEGAAPRPPRPRRTLTVDLTFTEPESRVPRRAARVARRQRARRRAAARRGRRTTPGAATGSAASYDGGWAARALADRVRRPRRDADRVGDLLRGARPRAARRCPPTCSACCSPARR